MLWINQSTGFTISLFWSQILKFWLIQRTRLFWKSKNRSQSLFENQNKIWLFFSRKELDSDKTLSELHIHYKSFLTRVYDDAGCKEYCEDFTVVLKLVDVFNKKQMYESVITGKNASKDWNCIISMFLTSLMSVLCLVIHFSCMICLKTTLCFFLLFWDKVWLFWWRRFGNPVKATNTSIYSLSLSPRFRIRG